MSKREQPRAASELLGQSAARPVNHASSPDETEDSDTRRPPLVEPGRPGRLPRSEEIPRAQAAIVGANLRALRHRHGMTQGQFGALMGWTAQSTVCAAEGRRGGHQRSFTHAEVAHLADIFDVTPAQLSTRCIHCEGHPPPGYACLTCGVQAAPEPVSGTR